MNYKMTPLMMFIFLLLLFLISIYFVYDFKKLEGFLSYNFDTPALNQLYISQYSKSNLVYKLHDSIYFDNINGNVIELFGKEFNPGKITTSRTDAIDKDGKTLTNIVLISRPPTTQAKMIIRHYDRSVGDVIDNSIIETNTINSFIYDMIPNESTLFTRDHLTYNYQILYISWGKDTIIHIYDCSQTKNINVGTYLFRSSYDPLHYLYRGNLIFPMISYRGNNISQNNTFQPEVLYDEKKQTSLFQLTSTILFDTTNRYLIVRAKKTISVYDGTLDSDGMNAKIIYENINEKGKIINTPNTINMNNFTKFQVLYISDTENSALILYVALPSTKKTLIAVLAMDPNVAGLLAIKCIKTFNQDNVSGLGLDGFELKNEQDQKLPSNDDKPIQAPSCNDKPIQAPSCNEKPIQASLRGSTYLGNRCSPAPSEDYVTPSLESAISDYFHRHWKENTSFVSNMSHLSQNNDYLITNQFKSPQGRQNDNDNAPTDSLGNNIDDFLTSLSNIRLSETVDSSGKKSIEYTGSLSRNFYLDSFLRNIPGLQITDRVTPTTSTTTTTPTTTTTTTPTTTTTTTPTTTTTTTPPTTTTTKTTTSTPTSSSTSTVTSLPTISTKAIPTSLPVQLNPPAMPYKNINYDENNNNSSYVYTASLKSPGPTFGNRIVPDGSADYYSYYGSLPEKEPSNFIPLAGNFSKFGM